MPILFLLNETLYLNMNNVWLWCIYVWM